MGTMKEKAERIKWLQRQRADHQLELKTINEELKLAQADLVSMASGSPLFDAETGEVKE